MTLYYYFQDSAKSFHDNENYTLIDYNRVGMPLLEIVTDPEIDNPEDGKLAVKEIQDLLKYRQYIEDYPFLLEH